MFFLFYSEGKSGSSKSNSKRRHSAGEGLDVTPSLVAAAGPSGAPSAYYVPGQRRGTFLPTSSSLRAWGSAGGGGRDDKNSHLASAEEILLFRAAVEYLLPEDVSVEDYKRCFEEGRFKTSLCPLPLPPMDCMPSPTKMMLAAAEKQQQLAGDACLCDVLFNYIITIIVCAFVPVFFSR